MELNKNKFYEIAKPFFDNGLMTEIFSTDKICVCNLANTGYAVFNYIIEGSGPSGLILNTEHVRELASNELYIILYLKLWDKKVIKSRTLVLNDRLYSFLVDAKKKTDLNGPVSSIDFEMEKEIMNIKGKGRK